MNKTNNLGYIASKLNEALYSHISYINIEGKPDTFEGKLCRKIIKLNTDLRVMIDEIETEMKKRDAPYETAFFKSHPELNP